MGVVDVHDLGPPRSTRLDRTRFDAARGLGAGPLCPKVHSNWVCFAFRRYGKIPQIIVRCRVLGLQI